MNEQDALWNEVNGIFLADEATDQAVIAYQSGDLTELGRIIAAHINLQISTRRERLAAYDRRIAEGERRGQRYTLTARGFDTVTTDEGFNAVYEAEAARLQGGVL